MLRSPPSPRMDIPISMENYYQLLSATSNSDYQKEHWEIAAEAINEWMRRHNPDALSMPAANGYQWKRVFLPDGTLLRTVFGGKNYHCLVEGDRILYNGQPVSPSGFVNAVGGIRRNAWLCTWILFPDTKEWKLADDFRTHARPRRARTQAPASEPGTFADAAPVNAPSPAKMEGLAESASETPPVAQAVHGEAPRPVALAVDGEAPRSAAGGEVRLQLHRAAIALSPRRSTDGAERRTGGDDAMTAFLRNELLPILCRICALDGSHSPASASHGG